jgi:hypothetical protein
MNGIFSSAAPQALFSLESKNRFFFSPKKEMVFEPPVPPPGTKAVARAAALAQDPSPCNLPQKGVY